MSSISQTLTPLPTPPSRNDPANFNQRADDFLAALPTFKDELDNFGSQTNTVVNDVNTMRNAVKSHRDAAYAYRNDAQNAEASANAYKLAAESAANRAEAVVVPTEATYGLDALETALNGLLTQLVAQQAQISILKG